MIRYHISLPVQRLMGRQTKTLVNTTSISPKTTRPRKEFVQCNNKIIYYNQHAIEISWNWRASTRGSERWHMETSDVTYVNPHSHNIVAPQGKCYHRNRRNLRNLATNANINASIDNYLDNQLHVIQVNQLLNSLEFMKLYHFNIRKEILRPQFIMQTHFCNSHAHSAQLVTFECCDYFTTYCTPFCNKGDVTCIA